MRQSYLAPDIVAAILEGGAARIADPEKIPRNTYLARLGRTAAAAWVYLTRDISE